MHACRPGCAGSCSACMQAWLRSQACAGICTSSGACPRPWELRARAVVCASMLTDQRSLRATAHQCCSLWGCGGPRMTRGKTWNTQNGMAPGVPLLKRANVRTFQCPGSGSRERGSIPGEVDSVTTHLGQVPLGSLIHDPYTGGNPFQKQRYRAVSLRGRGGAGGNAAIAETPTDQSGTAPAPALGISNTLLGLSHYTA